MKITSVTIHASGDRSVGIPSATFEITGGGFIADTSDFAEPDAVEELRIAIADLFEDYITGEPVQVFLHGYDKEPAGRE